LTNIPSLSGYFNDFLKENTGLDYTLSYQSELLVHSALVRWFILNELQAQNRLVVEPSPYQSTNIKDVRHQNDAKT